MPDSRRFDGTIALGESLGVPDARLLAPHDWVRDAVLAGRPFLGVCLEGQLLASALGARIACGRLKVGIHDVFPQMLLSVIWLDFVGALTSARVIAA